MKQKKGKHSKTRQGFLLTFFEDECYQEKEVNGYWLVKRQSGNTGEWEVAIYEKEAFEKHKAFEDDKKKYPLLFGGEDEYIRSLWKS